MRSFKTEAIIIKRKNIGEADRIITIFTKHFGKMQVKATGVRKINSRRSSHIELLNYSILTLYKGARFSIVTEAETSEDFSDIKNDLEKIGFAYHICELINGLCAEEQENSKVFFLLKDALERLDSKEDTISVIHEFEIQLLRILGFWHRAPEQSVNLNTYSFIENILERKLKSKNIFLKLQ